MGEANLREANLGEANLGEANLDRANLGGANLEGAKNLTEEQVRSANGAILPDSLPDSVKDLTNWGQPQAALADYDRALELEPTNAEAYYNRGNAKREIGRITEAREDYQAALALAQAAGDKDVVATATAALSLLDNNEAP